MSQPEGCVLHRSALTGTDDGGGLENLVAAVRYTERDNAVHHILLTARRIYPGSRKLVPDGFRDAL